MKSKYILEILEPESDSNVITRFFSSTPFGNIPIESIITPVAESRAYNESLIVENIDTRIWIEDNANTIKTIIHTTLMSKKRKFRKKLVK